MPFHRKENNKEYFEIMDKIDECVKELGFKTFDARVLIDPNNFTQHLVIRIEKELPNQV